MKKTVLVLAVAVIVMGTMSVAFADADWGPVAILANEKGITEDAAYELKVESGLTFGELAKEEGVYEAFKEAAFAKKEAMITEMVASGELSKEDAEQMLLAFDNCDGSSDSILKSSGHFGQKLQNREGRGQMLRDGKGFGQGQGHGQMKRTGSN